MNEKTIFEVLYDGPGAGPAGDGTYVARFRTRREADRFAIAHTCWGGTCEIQESRVPRRLAARYGLA